MLAPAGSLYGQDKGVGLSSADFRKRPPGLTIWCQANARKVVRIEFGHGENEMVKFVAGPGACLTPAAQDQALKDPALPAVLDRLDRTMHLAALVPERKFQEILALVGDLGDVVSGDMTNWPSGDTRNWSPR